MKKTWAAMAMCAGLNAVSAAAESNTGFWQHRIQTEMPIAAAPARVWALLMDFERHPQWNPFIRHIEGHAEVGQKLRVRVQPAGGREMGFDPQVLVVKPLEEFRWKGRFVMPGLFDGEHYFQLRPQTDGGTLLVHGERFSGLLVPLLRGQLDAGTRSGFEAMNEALKQALLKTDAML